MDLSQTNTAIPQTQRSGYMVPDTVNHGAQRCDCIIPGRVNMVYYVQRI